MGYKGEKLCVFCKWFSMDEGFAGYSEYTPGINAEAVCMKDKDRCKGYIIDPGYSTTDRFYLNETDFRIQIRTAETCPHFELPDELLDEMKNG